MTYENVVSWCEKNLPQEEYDNFSDWYDACYEKVNTPNLFDNPDFNRMMEDSWLGTFGTFERSKTEIVTSAYVDSQVKLPQELPSEQERQIPTTEKAPELPKPQLVFPEQKQKESRIQKFKQSLRGLFRR